MTDAQRQKINRFFNARQGDTDPERYVSAAAKGFAESIANNLEDDETIDGALFGLRSVVGLVKEELRLQGD